MKPAARASLPPGWPQHFEDEDHDEEEEHVPIKKGWEVSNALLLTQLERIPQDAVLVLVSLGTICTLRVCGGV